MTQAKPYESSIVPLGSIGGGCMQIDSRGRLYSRIAHPHEAGVFMTNCYPTLRLQPARGPIYARRLCGKNATDRDMDGMVDAPPFLSPRQYHRLVNYPVTTYQLRDATAPARVIWSYFSPLIPYDHVASVMPAVFLGIKIFNTSKQPLRCSVMFTLDNGALTVLTDGEASAPPIYAMRVAITDDNRNHLGANLFRGAIAEAAPDAVDESYVRNALLFGERRNMGTGPQPQLCLTVREHHEANITSAIWDFASEKSCAKRWQSFMDMGELPMHQPDVRANTGALCVAVKLAPGASHRADFILSWHLPPTACKRLDVHVGYGASFSSAPETTRYGLKHLTYLYAAINNWHKQLTSSSLPTSFIESLMASIRALVTHARHAPENGFRVALTSQSSQTTEVQWHFFTSLALLMFAPRFHAAAVTTCLSDMTESGSMRPVSDAAMRAQAELMLSAYADTLFTGNRARLCGWYPYFVSMSENWTASGLSGSAPQLDNGETCSEETIGLWAAALHALARMAQIDNNAAAAKRYDAAARLLASVFNTRLTALHNEIQSDVLPNQAKSPLIAAFAGGCAAKLLHLPTPVQNDHLLREALTECLSAPNPTDGIPRFPSAAFTALTAYALYGQGEGKEGANDNVASLVECYNRMLPPLDAASFPNQFNMLGLWTVLQSVNGVQYDALNRVVYICPSPLSMKDDNLPVFTPVSLGKLITHAACGEEFILLLRLTLDTPLSIEAVNLELPMRLAAVKVSCVHDNETLKTEQQTATDSNTTYVNLRFKSPLKMTDMLSLRLREESERPAP